MSAPPSPNYLNNNLSTPLNQDTPNIQSTQENNEIPVNQENFPPIEDIKTEINYIILVILVITYLGSIGLFCFGLYSLIATGKSKDGRYIVSGIVLFLIMMYLDNDCPFYGYIKVDNIAQTILFINRKVLFLLTKKKTVNLSSIQSINIKTNLDIGRSGKRRSGFIGYNVNVSTTEGEAFTAITSWEGGRRKYIYQFLYKYFGNKVTNDMVVIPENAQGYVTGLAQNQGYTY